MQMDTSNQTDIKKKEVRALKEEISRLEVRIKQMRQRMGEEDKKLMERHEIMIQTEQRIRNMDGVIYLKKQNQKNKRQSISPNMRGPSTIDMMTDGYSPE